MTLLARRKAAAPPPPPAPDVLERFRALRDAYARRSAQAIRAKEFRWRDLPPPERADEAGAAWADVMLREIARGGAVDWLRDNPQLRDAAREVGLRRSADLRALVKAALPDVAQNGA